MTKHSKIYPLKSYECDERLQLRLRSLFNFFQDMADENAAQLGIGYDFCEARGMAWIGVGYHLRINRLPRWQEKVTLSTWASGKTNVFGLRDFEMTDAAGQPLLQATSRWALIDQKTLRPLPAGKYLSESQIVAPSVVPDAFDKFALPEVFPLQKEFPVHADEIDLNGHVNNGVYPAWLTDAFEDDFLQNNRLKELQILFKTSAKKEHRVRLESFFDSETVAAHRLVNAATGAVFALARTVFEKKESDAV